MTRNSYVRLFGAATLATALAIPICFQTARADTVDGKTRVVLAVDGIKEIRNLPALLADSLGYFKDEGLIVTLMDGRDEAPTETLLADGRVDGAIAFVHHTFMTQARGLPTESVITMGVSPALTLVVSERLRDRVHSVADLKGMKIFTGGGNSGKTTTANWLMAKAGLSYKDFTSLQPNGREKTLKSLESGEADAVVAHEPDATFYETSGGGFKLADITTAEGTKKNLGSLFPSTSLYMPNAYVKANPETVQHLVNALAKSLKYINEHTPEQIAAVLPEEVFKKEKHYKEVLPIDVKMFTTNGVTSAADLKVELQVMADYMPEYRVVNLDETYTNEFIDKALKAAK